MGDDGGKGMRILTYKRTHTGDPDRLGRFGINDCMGGVRNLRFDAVIGVGGTGAEPRRFGIARKLTWIGVGPRRSSGGMGRRGDIVTFDHFLLLDANGPELGSMAPNLARRIYGRRTRLVLDAYSEAERAEALAILEWARKVSVPRPSAPGVPKTCSKFPGRCKRLKGSTGNRVVAACSPRTTP